MLRLFFVKIFIALLLSLSHYTLLAQPQPCPVENAEMTSTCVEACIVCDIDGFKGRHESDVSGSLPNDFCTFTVHNAQWIAFQAASTDIKIKLSVSNCNLGNGLEMAIYKGTDCNGFIMISKCRGGTNAISEGASDVFENTEPLVIGQYYYLAMDGNFGDNCDWQFEVVEGSTQVSPLTLTAPIEGPKRICSNVMTSYNTPPEEGAVLFEWTLNGETIGDDTKPFVDLVFDDIGFYTLCVTAKNACDEAVPTCQEIEVYALPPTILEAKICEGDHYEVADTSLSTTGNYEFNLTNSEGCDSTIYLNLEVESAPFTDLGRINICEDDALFIGGEAFSETGIHTKVLPSSLDCDSTILLDLFVVVCNIEGTIEAKPVICKGTSSGALSFSITKGTPPFSYTWSNLEANNNGNGIINNLNEAQKLVDLTAGTYLISIEDDFGNQRILIEEITEPAQLENEWKLSNFNNYNISCFDNNDASVEILPMGGTSPYSFLWSDNSNDAKRQMLKEGLYKVTIIDANGCELETEIVLNQPSALELNTQFINPSCDGGETGKIIGEVVQGGVPPYFFSLNNSPFLANPVFENLSAGQYHLVVEDANGCRISNEGDLVAAKIPILDLEESITVELADSIRIIPEQVAFETTFEWRKDEGLSCFDCLEPFAKPTKSTSFHLTVMSEDGCRVADSIHFQVLKVRDVFIPNVFSPNQDGRNDLLTIHAGPEVSNIRSFTVFSRWGELLFEANNFSPNSEIGWKGSFDGNPLDNGVFFWVAIIDFIDGEQLTYSGDVTLLR
jgi:gliding motility-associated-like protein